MTTPDERARAVLHTKEFLEELCSSEAMPDVPDAVRAQARHLLRHYPGRMDLARASRLCPHLFELEPPKTHETGTGPQ
jgi:hypothetical protein